MMEETIWNIRVDSIMMVIQYIANAFSFQLRIMADGWTDFILFFLFGWFVPVSQYGCVWMTHQIWFFILWTFFSSAIFSVCLFSSDIQCGLCTHACIRFHSEWIIQDFFISSSFICFIFSWLWLMKCQIIFFLGFCTFWIWSIIIDRSFEGMNSLVGQNEVAQR